jgi:hypothetical protein
MTDYGEQGPTPTEDAAVDDPPTVEDVAAAQRRDHPEQVPVASDVADAGQGVDRTGPGSGAD